MTYQTKITALDNGPYLVKGPVLLVGAEGNEFSIPVAAGDASGVDASGTVPLAVQAHQTQHLEPTGKFAPTSSSRPSGRLGVLDDFPKEI